MRYFIASLLSALVLCFSQTGLSAQTATKTWVSSSGSDNNAGCPITAPCATFQQAYYQTVAGGEIEVKDSGDYGTLVINRAISVVSSGAAATISVPANNKGIIIAGGSNDTVLLRGLTINGHGLTSYGIYVASGRSVLIDNCIIDGTTYGLSFGSGAKITYTMVSNSVITQNNIGIDPGPAAYVALSGNRIAGNVLGIYNGTVYTYGDNLVNTNSSSDESSLSTQAVKKY